ncbi:nucleotide exchange factor GrpE [Tessaracoccus rhinocerotis]|uniref:Protein GrpE n=1 Tax=Tessaracoccus rhinocerotis TaxID=1689449 RepID=A0A553JZI2_9ACTN|nr:nucleotide exchange factor GrpE [Tessaracoccus rhinocerotis]
MTNSHEEVVGPLPHEEPETAAEQPLEGNLEQPAESESVAADSPAAEAGEAVTDWEAVAAERTEDLQRITAEYVNYKRRVDRDRNLARQAGVEAVVTDLMPVLDSIALARTHDDLAGGFKLVADELEKVTGKYGLVAFGEVGEEFDPNRHDALMEIPIEGGVTVTTVSQVMQQGYAIGERVIRPARVGVANPS